MTKWEYKFVHYLEYRSDNGEQREPFLNSLGDEGWELCAQSYMGSLTFKRPKTEGFVKTLARCDICGDPNCTEPNQKH